MTTEEGWINPLLLGGSEPATLEIRLYLAIGRSWGATSEEWETWDPDPERKGEAGEGYRCRCLAHVRPEWGGPVAGDPHQPHRLDAGPHPDHVLESHRAGRSSPTSSGSGTLTAKAGDVSPVRAMRRATSPQDRVSQPSWVSSRRRAPSNSRGMENRLGENWGEGKRDRERVRAGNGERSTGRTRRQA